MVNLCQKEVKIYYRKKSLQYVMLGKLDQFRTVQSLSCVQLCDPMDYAMLGFPVHHQLPEFTQTDVH